MSDKLANRAHLAGYGFGHLWGLVVALTAETVNPCAGSGPREGQLEGWALWCHRDGSS